MTSHALSALNLTVPTVPAIATTQPERRQSRPLPSVAELGQALPLALTLQHQIQRQRQAIRDILDGHDERLLVIVGPCSMHDDASILEYGEKLLELQSRLSERLLLVMRAYVEKPRTTVGWKGMVYDPHLDGRGDMAVGLERSRALMLRLVEMGLPLATELLQPLLAGYFEDLLSWGAIGARTSESQVHRELVSGLDLPVGFKNGTDGGLGIACDAIRSAAHPHRHFGMDARGLPALIETCGNPDTHIILRGGHAGPNYDADSVDLTCSTLQQQGIDARLVVDCSHANSGKDPQRQPDVLQEVVRQRLAGNAALRGVMIESHLFDGAQSISGERRHGVSVTDACLGWYGTAQMLIEAAIRLGQGHR